MKLLLTGGTGFLGNEVLRQALEDDGIEQILALTRRPIAATHAKLKALRHENFLDYSTPDLRSFDACLWCLGVSQGAVSEREYVRITVDYTLAAARALFIANPRARFCFVSGRSADPDEKSKRLFARVKGRAERQLWTLSDNVFVFRPGYIKPTQRSGPRKDIARLLAPIGALVSRFARDFSVNCDQLASCLLDTAKHGAATHLLINSDIRSWTKPTGENAA